MMVISIISGYFLFMNFFGFILMGVDKRKAKKREWRISESSFFVVALLGGSLGSIIGMYAFHHKTRHWYFVYGMPAILVLQVAIASFIYFYSPISFYIM